MMKALWLVLLGLDRTQNPNYILHSGSLHILNAPHKQQAVENQSITYQIKTEPPSRAMAMAEASFAFQMADRQIHRIVALALALALALTKF
jgi:hypothetical protein